MRIDAFDIDKVDRAPSAAARFHETALNHTGPPHLKIVEHILFPRRYVLSDSEPLREIYLWALFL